MSDDIHWSELRSAKDAMNTTTEIREIVRNGPILVSPAEASKQQRIEQLEAWVAQAISKPSMPRELRLQGMDLVEARSPNVRQAVERICPSQSREMGRELEIER
jgi:hypothetical protein